MTASFFAAFWRWGARGRRRGAKRPEKQGRGFASGPCFFVWQARGPLGPRAAKRRRPPGPLRFSAGQTSHSPPLSASASYKQNEPAAPHERRAGIFRRKTEEVFQLVFPRFFQKRKGGGAERRQWRKKRGGSPVRKGVEGSRFGGDAQRPLRTARGAEPPTGSRGIAPGGVRGSAPEKAPKAPARHPSAGRDWARRRRAGKSPWG